MDPLYKLLLGETCFTALCSEKGEKAFLVTKSRPLNTNNKHQQPYYSTPRQNGMHLTFPLFLVTLQTSLRYGKD